MTNSNKKLKSKMFIPHRYHSLGTTTKFNRFSPLCRGNTVQLPQETPSLPHSLVSQQYNYWKPHYMIL